MTLPKILDIPEKLMPMITEFDSYRYLLAEGGRGGGKCLHPDTLMLKYSGEIVPMRDINVGDLLRGVDNEPRKVLAKHIGYDDLYQVNQYNGCSYICNSSHLLSLKKRISCKKEKRKGVKGTYIKHRERYTSYEDTISMPIREFISQTDRFKNNFRGWKSDTIQYESQNITIDPYFLGIWLGDGDSNGVTITTMDKEIVSYIYKIADSYGMKVRDRVGGGIENRARRYSITNGLGQNNPILSQLQELNLIKNKHIPEQYILNGEKVQYELLAGLIDSDGFKPKDKLNHYSITQKNMIIIKGIERILNNLGFKCNITTKHNDTYNKDYHTISFSGDTSKIPCKLSRKQTNNIIPNFQWCYSKLNVRYWGHGEYQGIEVGGDNLYILPDRTVIHNSQGIARFLLYLGEKRELRICCGRETQNSIDESVHAILSDTIKEFDLNYEVFATKIVHRTTGTNFKFKGFREQGKVNIKGLEGVDILWVDESQSITKSTLDIIIPTIRKEQSKIFFSMNRYRKNDPVYTQLKDREDCKHIYINYDENQFCPKILLHEAKICKEQGDDGDYLHIWRGLPLDDLDNFLFTSSNLEETKNFEFMYNEANYGYRIGAFDIARMGSDRCSFVVLEQKGPMQWEEIYTELWRKKDLAHTTGRIMDRTSKFQLDISIVDGDGMGAGVRDIANFFSNSTKEIVEWRAGNKSPDDIDTKTGQKRITRRHRDIKSWAWHQVKDLIDNSWLKVNHHKILEDMETILYDFMPNGTRFIVGKQDAKSRELMRKQGITSPDAGEALMMAVSEIRHIRKICDIKVSNLPKYTEMDDNVVSMGRSLMKNLPTYTTGM